MPRCEDYPCCGHEAGDCPSRRRDGSAQWRCVECGRNLPRGATSSICARCLRSAHRRFHETGEMWGENGHIQSLALLFFSFVISGFIVFGILTVYHLADLAATHFPLK